MVQDISQTFDTFIRVLLYGRIRTRSGNATTDRSYHTGSTTLDRDPFWAKYLQNVPVAAEFLKKLCSSLRHFGPVLQIRITLMRTRILLVTLNAFPDPDPDPSLQIKAQKTLKKCSSRLIFYTFWLVICKLILMRIWIQLITWVRIRIRLLWYLPQYRTWLPCSRWPGRQNGDAFSIAWPAGYSQHPTTGSRQGKKSQVKISENVGMKKINLTWIPRPGERGRGGGESAAWFRQ